MDPIYSKNTINYHELHGEMNYIFGKDSFKCLLETWLMKIFSSKWSSAS